jgi:hypothetical protein
MDGTLKKSDACAFSPQDKKLEIELISHLVLHFGLFTKMLCHLYHALSFLVIIIYSFLAKK